ncbi:MAG: hypothetical protein ACRC0X_05320 [Brevinema sp.]
MFAPVSKNDDIHQLEIPPKGDNMGENTEEEDCLGDLADDELEVYKFQKGISWDGVDLVFKSKVINAMRELYCHQRNQYIPWRILEISSAYRDAKDQARVMIDTYLHLDRRQLSKEYGSKWDVAVDLISDLYYDGNHLRCDGMCLVTSQSICEYSIQQKILLSKLPQNEQEVFRPYMDKDIETMTVNLQNNKLIAKIILED